MTKARRQSRGFTLLEVLIALAILGSALFILLECNYGALRLLDDSRQELRLRNLMSRALSMAEVEVLAGNMTGSGDFGKRFEDYEYSFDAQTLSEEVPGLYQVMVTVTGPDIDREMEMVVFRTGGL